MWITLWGRDFILRRWKPSRMEVAGWLSGGAGMTGLLVAGLEDFRPDLIGIVLLILGVMLICTKALMQKNMTADEIYHTGFESGEASGYEQGYADGLEEGRKARPRPTVVPIRQKCADCGNQIATSLVGSVADRG